MTNETRIEPRLVDAFAAAVLEAQRELRRTAYMLENPRVRIYRTGLGVWRSYLMRRLPHRFAEAQ